MLEYGFSKKSVTEALKEAKFTDEEVAYGVNNCNANWNQQALRASKDYIEGPAGFSKVALQTSLEEACGFTAEEAAYAANNCNADWNEQALKAASDLINYYDKEEVKNLLEIQGFTAEQVLYAMNNL